MKEAAAFLLLVVNDGSIWTSARYSSKTQFNKVFLLAERKDGDHNSTCKRNTKDEVKLRTGHSISAILLAKLAAWTRNTSVGKPYTSQLYPFNNMERFSTSILFLHVRLPLILPREEMSSAISSFYLLPGISRDPIRYTLEYLSILIFHQERIKSNAYMSSSVVTKQ